MTKKGKKKAKIIDYDSDDEVVEAPPLRIEIVYEDTKAVTRADPEFKWGQIYHWLVEKKVLEVGLEDLALYDNVLRSRITKVTTWPEMFPCAECLGWIVSRVDTKGMLMNDIENKTFASFSLAFLLASYNLPKKEVSVTTEGVKGLKFDYTPKARMFMIDRKNFRNKQSEKYKTSHLKTPYR